MAKEVQVSGLLAELDALKSSSRQAGGFKCRVAFAYDSLEGAEREALAHLIDGTDVFASNIGRTLRGHGIDIKDSNIQRHRRRSTGGGCLCPPPTETP